MSSIPVKRNRIVTRRSEVVKENINQNSSESKVGSKIACKESKHRPVVCQVSKKELEDENARLNSLILNYEHKLGDLKSKLNTTEEKLLKATNEAHTVQNTWEKRILSYNIDPVIKVKISQSAEEEKNIETCREKSKVKVQVLKEKLQHINSVSVAYISQLEEFSSQLRKDDDNEIQKTCGQNT